MTATLSPDARIDAERGSRRLLPHVSRTFALGIRLLPPRLERPVRVGYLLCRIADTVEDDLALAPERKAALLDRFAACFDDPDAAAAFADVAAELTGDPHHLDLVARTGHVFLEERGLDEDSRAILRRWVLEMVGGMREFVLAHPRGLRIGTVAEFRRYCYYVAGTVGHLLTELWHRHSMWIDERVVARLLPDCEAFAEALQTVNIVKDVAWDAERENAVYVPAEALAAVGSGHEAILDAARRATNRSALETLVAIARDDVERALDYIAALPQAAVRIRLFCALPILFCVATLREIERTDAMLAPGGAVKIARDEVKALCFAAPSAVLTNTTLRWLVARVRRRPFTLAGA